MMKNAKAEGLKAGNPYAKKELLPKHLFRIQDIRERHRTLSSGLWPMQ
jgi:hypothetical protein